MERPEQTLRDYVVTPQLAKCFDDALSLVRDALEGRTSKACYLLGSFGSGKSHFMAVLNLLLQNATAREIAELADAVTKHNPSTSGKKFMLVSATRRLRMQSKFRSLTDTSHRHRVSSVFLATICSMTSCQVLVPSFGSAAFM